MFRTFIARVSVLFPSLSLASKKMRGTCLLLVCLSAQIVADVAVKTLNEDLTRFISSTKGELAQNFFGPRLVRKDVAKFRITEEKNWEITIAGIGRSAALFRRSKDNFIVNGSQILQLRKNPFSEDENSHKYFLDSTQEFSMEEGAILFQQTEWNNIFFLAVCHHRNYCRTLISHPTINIVFEQRFAVLSTPTDIEFFVDDEELFLIVAGDSCKIYRWTGAYFDEHDELDTSGARAVTTFRGMDSTIIVVAQSLKMKEVYSKVFVRRNRKTELIQMLQTKEASDVVSYSVRSGNKTNNFIFVLNNWDKSTVFWWNGREFSLWKSVEDVVGPGRIYIHELHSQLFFFFAHQNKLSVYHPTEVTFDLVHFLELDRDILGLDLREEGDSSPMLVLLKGSHLGSLLTITVLSVDVNYIPQTANQMAIDPVLQCLFQLKNLLHDRESKLNESMFLSNEIGKKSEVTELGRLTTPKLELKSFKISKLMVNPLEEELQATPTEIRKELEKLREEYNFLFPKLEPLLKQVRYRFHGDIFVGRMEASNIYANKFNGRPFDLNNILSVTKNQTLSGAIRLKTLSANALTVPSINGVYTKDLLVRNKSLQEITGEHTIRSMKVGNVVFGKLGKLNGTLFCSKRESNDGAAVASVGQRKTFPRITLRQLFADSINNEPAEQWLARILPSNRDFEPEAALNFTQLEVKHLIVSKINGKTWKNYLESSTWYDENGKENESRLVNIDSRHLRATKINGIEAASFLTKDTLQEVDSTIKTTSATVSRVKANSFIGALSFPSFSVQHQGNQENNGISRPLAVFEIIFKKPANLSGKIIHFNNLKNSYWMKSLPQETDTFITFTNQVAIKNLESKRINGKSTDEFATGEGPKVSEGKLLFEKAKVYGDVAVSQGAYQNVNLEKLYDSAVKGNGENRVKGKKLFLGNVSISKSLSLESFSGFPLDYSLSPGISLVENVEITGNVSVKNGVELDCLNGHNFNDIVTNHVSLDEGNILQKAKFSSLSVKEIQAGNVNGIGGDANHLKVDKTRARLRIVIKGDLEVPKINVNTVNDIALNEYLKRVVLKNGTRSNVKGRKQFEGVVTVIGDLEGSLNGYNFRELEKITLSKSKPQNVTGTFTVDVLNVNNAEVEVMDGVFCGNLLYQDESQLQTIHSDILFSDFAINGNIKSDNFMDGCDFSKMNRLKVNEIKKVGKLDVMGNVIWRRDRGEYKGISYLYENSVTKDDEQVVEGSITFHEKVEFDKITTKSHINGVDIQFIVEDGIFRSLPVQEIFQDVTFRGNLTANNGLTENNVIVDNINGVDILDIGIRLIRNNAETEIRGKKKFLTGFTTRRMTVEAVNGVETDPIIFCDGEPENGSILFPATVFDSVKTLNDINVLRVNDVNLSNLLQERLSKKTMEIVKATLRLEGAVSIKGDSGISRINHLNINDTVLTDGKTDAKSILGKIEFNNTMSAMEKLKVEKLNNRDVRELKERALTNMSESVVKGSVIFKEDVEFRGNLDTFHQIVSCQTKNIRPMQVPIKIGYPETNYRRKISVEMDKIENNSKTLMKPVVFIDLHARAKLNVGLVKFEKIKFRYHRNYVDFDFYGIDNNDRCQPNVECQCFVQKNMAIFSSLSHVSTIPPSVFPKYYKYYEEQLNVEVNVTVLTSSTNSRCVDEIDINNEHARVNWRRLVGNDLDEGREDGTNEHSANLTGRLSDVQFFTIDKSIFIIMACYVRPLESKMSRLNVTVLELNVEREGMRKIQEMEMEGVEKINLFWTPKGVVLVAGNGYDSDVFSDSVDSAIFRFSDSDNQFRLLRSVKTHGILDIATIRVEQESFIFLVQKEWWPFLILKYNHEYDNYYFSQKLYADPSRSKSNFLSAAAFTTARSGYEGDIFVGLVHSDGGFQIFKYKHIEGFVEELSREHKNLEMIIPFRMVSGQYLFAASSGNNSVIYELAS